MGLYNFYYFDKTYILVLIGALLSIWASSTVKSTFARYSKVISKKGMTGAETAQQILRGAGIYDVSVQQVRGELTDHFDPKAKVLRLSESVYGSRSVAAVCVAAHECGHAMQHNEKYVPLELRNAFLPIANIGSKAGIPIIILGVLISYFQPLISLGIVVFSFGVFFQVMTLPVEFDASHRAIAVLDATGILTKEELAGSEKVLRAAALTYVASAAASILQLVRLILLFGGGRRNRD